MLKRHEYRRCIRRRRSSLTVKAPERHTTIRPRIGGGHVIDKFRYLMLCGCPARSSFYRELRAFSALMPDNRIAQSGGNLRHRSFRLAPPENRRPPTRESAVGQTQRQRQRQYVGTHRVTHHFQVFGNAPGNACITVVAILPATDWLAWRYRLLMQNDRNVHNDRAARPPGPET